MKHWIEITFSPEQLAKAGVPSNAIPDAPHLTLLYLGEGWDPALLDEALLWFTRKGQAGRIDVNGFGVLLQGPRQTPVVFVNHKTLPRIFTDLVNAVEGFGLKEVKLDYGFQPHITLTRPASLRFPGKLDVTALTLCATWKDDEGKKHVKRDVYPLLPKDGR